MATTVLSVEGEKFIRKVCNGTGTSLVMGSAKDKRGYSENIDAILPYCYPKTSVDKIWKSNPDINDGITNNGQLGEKLIYWYNKYAEDYGMDANILAAQAYQESKFIIWNYAVNSSASGISQFIAAAVYDVIVKNIHGGMTEDERRAITKDVSGYEFGAGYKAPSIPFLLDGTRLANENRPIIHQNIIDNPKIMIKAQFEYMKYMSNRSNKLASVSLFGYNRGPKFATSKTYNENIMAARDYKPGYEIEGVDYVFKIFLNLYKNFGYKELDMTPDAEKKFNEFYSSLG